METQATVPVVAVPHPFSSQALRVTVDAGRTISEILEIVQPDPILRRHARVFVDDWFIPADRYHLVRPKAGRRVTLRVIPSDDGGGGKNILRTIAIIVVVAIAVAAGQYYAPALAGGALGSGGTAASIGGAVAGAVAGIAFNALWPLPQPKLDDLTGVPTASPSANIQGARNTARPYQPVPQILGKRRLVPAYAALPFTELVGADQYIRLLFSLGFGPLKIEQTKIGETDLDQYADVESEFRRGFKSSQITAKGNWDASAGTYPTPAVFGDRYQVNVAGTVDGVSYVADDTITYQGLGATVQESASWDKNEHLPITLYPNQVIETPLSVLLQPSSGNQPVQTSETDADEISVDITFPQGILLTTATGQRFAGTVDVTVEYRVANQSPAPAWTSAGTIKTVGQSTSQIRRGLRFAVPRGQYEVRLTRTTVDLSSGIDGPVFDDVFWTILRSFTNEQPTTIDGEALFALRIRATDQLNGVVDQFNLVGTSIIKNYDGVSAWKDEPTSNPAALYRHVSQDIANPSPLADARLGIAVLEDWHTENAANGREFNQVRDFPATVMDVLADVSSVGRARLAAPDGKYAVAIGRAQTSHVQWFTPRNSWAYRGTRAFIDMPHAVRARFENRDRNWEQDVQTIYADGFDENNATVFQTIQAIGITDPARVWQEGRFMLAQAALQPETHEFFADVENLVCTAGDLVGFAHDVPLFALGWGRVKSLITTGSPAQIAGVVIDDSVVMEPAKSYGIRFRMAGASETTDVIAAVVLAVGEQTSVTFQTPIPASGGPQAGDLYVFGESGKESIDLVIKQIEPRGDLSARIVCANYNAALWGDLGAIPPFDSQISLPAGFAVPAIQTIQSDETVLVRAPSGALLSRIVMTLIRTTEVAADVVGVQVGWRETGTDQPFVFTAVQPIDQTRAIVEDLEDGQSYELKLRYVKQDGDVGPWSGTTIHTVVGKGTAPGPLSGLSISVFGGQANMRWDAPTELDVLFGGLVRFRHSDEFTGATWSSSVSIGDTALAGGQIATLPLLPGTYLARVVDSGGNASTVVSVTTKQASLLPFTNLHAIREDQQSPAFQGAKTNVEVSSGALRLSQVGSPSSSVAEFGTYEFRDTLDMGSVLKVRATAVIQAGASNIFDLIDSRTELIDDWAAFDGDADGQGDLILFERHTDDNPTGSPAATWSPWQRLDSAEFDTRGFQFKAELSTNDTAFNVTITQLGVTVDEFDTTA